MPKIVAPNFEMTKIKLIMFDKDGTLFDLHFYWLAMIKFRTEVILEHCFNNGLTFDSQESMAIRESMGEVIGENHLNSEGPIGKKSRKAIAFIVSEKIQELGVEGSPEKVESLFKIADKISEGQLKYLIKPLPGVEEFILSCFHKGIKLAIVTNDIEERTKLGLRLVGLDQYFEMVYGSDSLSKGKPDPMIWDCIKKSTNVSEKEAIVIGDSTSDINFAKNSKVNCVAVATGLDSISFLKDHIEFVVRDLTELGVEL